MATIEPRLIHLLNGPNDTSGSRHPREAGARVLDRAPADNDDENRYSYARHVAAPDAGPAAPGYPDSQQLEVAVDGNRLFNTGHAGLQPPLGLGSLKPLLDLDSEQSELGNSVGKPLDSPSATDDGSGQKRVRSLAIKDDLIQLPQPFKKQRLTPIPAPVMPPIINGLHEPPPHAAMFPPIAPHEFDQQEVDKLSLLHEFSQTADDDHSSAPASTKDDDGTAWKTRKRATRPRKKWSEEETNHLLLGVHQYGVGKWTSILEDPSFKFNGRSAGDLKDRFRTCCPTELQRPLKRSSADLPIRAIASRGPRLSQAALSDNEAEGDGWLSKDSVGGSQDAEDSAEGKAKKSRAHRKEVKDLEVLGIHGPFKKSHRRARRPFTEQDDKEILEGLEHYGPAWTKIQRDPRFHLSSRQPTDLRDRVRNKYQSVYQRIEKGTLVLAESSGKKDWANRETLQPAVLMAIKTPLEGPSRPKRATMEPSMNRPESNEDVLRWPSQPHERDDNLASLPGFDLGEASAPHLNGGEMDIARLLLDETK